jgi:hypothetical protein
MLVLMLVNSFVHSVFIDNFSYCVSGIGYKKVNGLFPWDAHKLVVEID